jgi:hypothetical protein
VRYDAHSGNAHGHEERPTSWRRPHDAKADPAGGGQGAPTRLEPGEHGAQRWHSVTAGGPKPESDDGYARNPCMKRPHLEHTAKRRGGWETLGRRSTARCRGTGLWIRAEPRWLQGCTPSAEVGGTGWVPYGRQAGADGQAQHGSLGERRKRVGRSVRAAVETPPQPGLAAAEVISAGQRGRSRPRLGKPTTGRRAAVRARGAARGRED